MSKLMTPKEVADHLGVTINTVYKWVAANKIPYVKLNKSVRFNPSKLESWINSRSISAYKA